MHSEVPAPLASDPLFARFQAVIAGRYFLDRELGRGGMGVVYLAYEVRLQRPVAIKLLPPELAAHVLLRERFLREARTAARLSHPNIVPVHAVDDIAEWVYYAMAYVPGETLARRVARGPLPAMEAARVLREVAWALDYAHVQGTVHRDIKPENVILEQGTGRAMVTDFGIAAVEWDTRDTAPGQLLGTPEFMSPEQAGGETVDGRSDLYSVGALGYYLLSGKPPFQGATTARLLAQHLTAPVPSLAASAPGTPDALAQLLERCLAKERGERPVSGAQLAEELGLVLQAHAEPPAMLRAIARQTRWMLVGACVPGLIIAIRGIQDATALGTGTVVSFATVAAAITAAFLLYLLDSQLKQLRDAGYGPGDLAEAADAQARGRADEASSLSRVTPFQRSPRSARRGLWLWFGLFVLEGGGILGFGASIGDYVALLGFAAGALGQIMVLEAFRRPPRTRRSLFGRFWASRFIAGRWQRLTASTPEPSAAPLPRLTEMRLGQTVEHLLAALPLDLRRQLPDVLPVVRRLEARAQSVRQRLEDLDRLLATARRGHDADPAAARRSLLLAALGTSKAASERQLEELAAALEIIRLDLLRLTASTATLEGVTADLAAAARLDAHTEQLLAGWEEVARLTGERDDHTTAR